MLNIPKFLSYHLDQTFLLKYLRLNLLLLKNVATTVLLFQNIFAFINNKNIFISWYKYRATDTHIYYGYSLWF